MNEAENILIWAENLKIGQSLEDFNLTVKRNEIVGIKGLSTEEKQELFNVFGCIKKPVKGRYIFDYEDTSLLETSRLEAIRRDKIGFIFNSPILFDDLSVLENVILCVDYLYPRKKACEMGMNILKEFGIEDKSRFRIDQLNNYEKVLISFGRALVNKPLMLLIDDIFTYLKPNEIVEVNKLMMKIAYNCTTIIILANDFNNMSMIDRIVNL